MAKADSNSFDVRINVPTPLAVAAAKMAPGSWITFACNYLSGQDLNYILDSTRPNGASQLLTGYGEKMAWDPSLRKVYFTGGGHSAVNRTIEYDDDTNTWIRVGDTPWQPFPEVEHAYGHNTSSPGLHYHMRFQTNVVMERDVSQGNSWSQLPTLPSNFGAFGSLEWFPTYSGGVAGGSLITIKGDRGGIWRFDGTSWRNPGTVSMGARGNLCLYSPVRDILYFGGGAGSDTFHIMSNTGGITSGLSACPAGQLYINNVLPFTDPRNGNLVVVGRDQIVREYNPDTNGWSTVTGPDANFWTNTFIEGPVMAVVAASIPMYQVTMFISIRTPNIYLRKGG